MLDALRSWIMAVCGTALLWGVGMALAGERGRKTLGVIGGFATMAAMLSLAGDINAPGIGVYVERYRQEAGEIAGEAQRRAETETRFIIEERCEAYILDKAGQLGVTLRDVAVTAKWSGEGFWYPYRCTLRGVESRELSRAIEAELGIAPENQTWSTDDGHQEEN